MRDGINYNLCMGAKLLLDNPSFTWDILMEAQLKEVSV